MAKKTPILLPTKGDAAKALTGIPTMPRKGVRIGPKPTPPTKKRGRVGESERGTTPARPLLMPLPRKKPMLPRRRATAKVMRKENQNQHQKQHNVW
jgi:hypothetical protein